MKKVLPVFLCLTMCGQMINVWGQKPYDARIKGKEILTPEPAKKPRINSPEVYGLKAGIYTSPGETTCQQFEGSYGNEIRDAATYAGWGFDLLKYDWCSYGQIWNLMKGDKLENRPIPYKLMSAALEAQDRDIVLNICEYGYQLWEWGREAGGHSWRIGGDLGHTLTRGGVYEIAEKNIGLREPGAASDELKMLIMTGRNNHNWKQTTAVLDSTMKDCGLFSVDVTTEPDTLKFEDLKKYDALLNNWNSWPENNVRWPEAAEQGLLRYVDEGGGLVFFHSATSAFYTWPEFKQISTAAWIIDSTWHGPVSQVKVSVQNREHPITRGLADFFILDELWIDAEQNEAFQVLGTAANTGEDTGEQPAIFVGTYGKGRIFHTILGHDETALRNSGFQSLILRAAEWASTGQVSIPVSK